MPDIPVNPPPEPKPKASSVRVTEEENDGEEAVPGGIPLVNTRIIAAVIDLLMATRIYWTPAMNPEARQRGLTPTRGRRQEPQRT